MSQKSKKSQKTLQRYRLVSDNDGHDYIIEAGEEKLFYSWVDAMEEGNDTILNYDSNRVNNSGWTFTDPQGY